MFPDLSNNSEVYQLANLELLARQVVEGFVTGPASKPVPWFLG